MSYLDNSFYIVLDDPQQFEFDRDYILAASALIDNLPVYLTPAYKEILQKHTIYSKQFLGLSEFGIQIIVTDILPPSPVMHIHHPDLINYDELVDLAVNFNGGKNDAR